MSKVGTLLVRFLGLVFGLIGVGALLVAVLRLDVGWAGTVIVCFLIARWALFQFRTEDAAAKEEPA
jgi:hypothetical protein